jgi:hypothetical protein
MHAPLRRLCASVTMKTAPNTIAAVRHAEFHDLK